MEQLVIDQGFLLDSLMNVTPDAIYFKDLDSRFIMVNLACAKKHSMESPDAFKGKTDFDIFSNEHAEQAFADEQRIVQTSVPIYGIEEKETWPDGSVTWVSTTKMPIRNSEGKIVGTFGISRDITKRKQAELRARRYADEIRTIKEEMEEDVRMAGELQKNFFQASYPVFPEGTSPESSCVEFFHRFHTRRDVIGDYCSIARLSGSEVGIFLCDVGGSGVRAALGTALIRGIIQEIAVLGRDPGAYLGRMNKLLYPLLNHEGLLLDVSACYLVLDVATGQIRFANAGHPIPILFHDGFGARWLFDETIVTGLVLAERADTVYTTAECSVESGSSVVLFTDGLFTVKNNLGDPYGGKRLLDAAHSLADEPLEDIVQGLEGDVLAFSGDGKFSDDICIVGFHLRRLMGSG